jgi:hypothetical protein
LRQDPRKIFFQRLGPAIVFGDRNPGLRYSRDKLRTVEICWELDRADSQSKNVVSGDILHSLAGARQGSQSEKP